ncbi:hypothetical protein HMPREF0262_01418 [Clostridium sp. ATCC 29733]|nr:hypothetical protein HMPREF0262_01418 [Clostridium sp. ATCC 29733]
MRRSKSLFQLKSAVFFFYFVGFLSFFEEACILYKKCAFPFFWRQQIKLPYLTIDLIDQSLFLSFFSFFVVPYRFYEPNGKAHLL